MSDPQHLVVTDPLVTVTAHVSTFRDALSAACRLAQDPAVDEPQRQRYEAVAVELADALENATPVHRADRPAVIWQLEEPDEN